MKDRTVPIFELKEIQRGQRLEELRQCVTEKGVFYLKEDGPLKHAHTQAENAAMAFFATASDEAKRTVTNAMPNTRRGFSALESESTARCTKSGDYSDYAMVYSMGIAANVFPSAHFAQIWQPYFSLYYELARTTARAVLESMGSHVDTDVDALLDCDPVLRFRYFPEVPEDRYAEQQPNRMAPHYDLSIVSVVLQRPCPNGFVSLQVEIGGQFIELPPLSDCLVVFCGAVATLVSGGKIKVPTHRVISPSAAQRVGSDRTSSVLFLTPKPEFSFSVPLANACGMGEDLRGENATFGEWCGANYAEMHLVTNAS
jgi:deacetoxycephalosporin-C synthase/deacetoxycephalosporin-C hydroxylase